MPRCTGQGGNGQGKLQVSILRSEEALPHALLTRKEHMKDETKTLCIQRCDVQNCALPDRSVCSDANIPAPENVTVS